jgi:hypothetical protein
LMIDIGGGPLLRAKTDVDHGKASFDAWPDHDHVDVVPAITGIRPT